MRQEDGTRTLAPNQTSSSEHFTVACNKTKSQRREKDHIAAVRKSWHLLSGGTARTATPKPVRNRRKRVQNKAKPVHEPPLPVRENRLLVPKNRRLGPSLSGRAPPPSCRITGWRWAPGGVWLSNPRAIVQQFALDQSDLAGNHHVTPVLQHCAETSLRPSPRAS